MTNQTETPHHTTTRGHAPHSPSSLQSSEACSHYQSENRDSAASLAGTLQHRASETGDLSILDDPEQVEAVKRYLSIVAKWRTFLRAQGAEIEVLKEVYLSVGDEIEIDEEGNPWKGITGGYPDDVLLGTFPSGDQLAVIIDAKFGKHLVTPTASNMQGISYVRALMEKYPRIEEVCVQFFHPARERGPEGQIEELPEYTHTFERKEYTEMELRIRTIIARKKLAKSQGLFSTEVPPTPKTDLCIWCAKKALCPANGKLMVLGATKHKDIQVPDVFNPTLLTKPEDYATALKFANQFELVAKAIKKRVTDAALTEDVHVPGFELTRRRERNLGDFSQVKRVLIEGGFLTEEEFDNCANVPITKVETAIKAKALKGKGAVRLREFEEALTEAGLLTMGDGYMYLREVKGDKVAVEEKTLSI